MILITLKIGSLDPHNLNWLMTNLLNFFFFLKFQVVVFAKFCYKTDKQMVMKIIPPC